VVSRVEAVIRVFNRHGNRGNKNKARLKFVLRERGFEWLRDAIAEEYQDIVTNGGIAMPAEVPDGFGGFQPVPPPKGNGELLPVLQSESPEFSEKFNSWRETNVQPQKQPGYSIVIVKSPQGNLTADQMRSLAKLSEDAGDGSLRFTMNQNVVLGWVPNGAVKRVYKALVEIGLSGWGADEISDVITCPGAYSCNLALTKTMGLGAALEPILAKQTDSIIRRLHINASGCPNSCGQHWIGDIGFYGNARKIDGKEVPYYLMLLGGTQEQFGVAIQSLPARLVPTAVERVLDHFKSNRSDGESFRGYVMRFKVETFRKLTADLVKPAEMSPEMYNDWGDDVSYSLQLGKGECAA
jgi:sulfite reductase beta subunit-like hemoprotein